MGLHSNSRGAVKAETHDFAFERAADPDGSWDRAGSGAAEAVLSRNSADIGYATSIARGISYRSPGTNSDPLDATMIHSILLF